MNASASTDRMAHLAVALAMSVSGFVQAADPLSCAVPLAIVEPNGNVSAGSKQALRDAMAAGLPLRVGWTIDSSGQNRPEVRHWADALFLTEFEGEVFTQIVDIHAQVPTRGTRSIKLPGRKRWSGLIGTNGVLESHFDDGSAPTSLRVRSEWCVDPRALTCVVPHWRLVYRHDADGKGLAGSKERLFDAVRRGQPIRLAWGVSVQRGEQRITIEHAAVPEFLSITNGTELFVQLPEHIAQVAYHEPEQARFDKPAVMWRGLLGTNGKFDAVWVDRATGKEMRRLPQRAGVSWFAFAPEPACDAPALQLAVPGGVRAEP